MPTREASVRKVVARDPTMVARLLLETPCWINGLEARTMYERFEDDTRHGMVGVVFTADADAWVEIFRIEDTEDPLATPRFRVPMHGGGQSPRVRNALMILALAIKLDNEEFPQDRG